MKSQKKISFLFFTFLLGIVALFYLSWAVYYDNFIATKEPKIETTEFKKIYGDFLNEADARRINLRNKYVEINFGQTEDLTLFQPNELAKCIFFPHPQIIVNKTKFYSQPYSIKEMTLFHELVHCLWIKPHVYNKYPHIMNEYSDPNLYTLYTHYRTEMLNDLFNADVYLKSYYLQAYINHISVSFGSYFWYFLLLAVGLLVVKDLFVKKIINSKKGIVPNEIK